MAEADTETADPSGQDPEVNQPGLSEVRDAVANHLERRLPSRASIRDDALAGLNSAVSSVPDAMASGILVGVNPIYGLYACMVGPIAGGIFSSTALMIIATTSAASLSAGQALGALQGDARDTALFLMVVLIGVLQMLFGLLGEAAEQAHRSTGVGRELDAHHLAGLDCPARDRRRVHR